VAGDLGLNRAAGKPVVSITVSALAALLKVSEDEAQSRWSALSPETKRKVGARGDVLAKIAELKSLQVSDKQGKLDSIL
jgi:hypothetical protein